MTHAAFPDLAGDNVFKTTETTVTDAPTTVVASFTTSADTELGQVVFTGHKDTALYIDWRGDGTEYVQYPVVDETYTAYLNQTTYAGANVKVYTYESADDISVFSISDIPMTDMDASPLKKLIAFTVSGGGLDENSLRLPVDSDLRELNLSGNNFSGTDFSQYFPNLVSLNLSGNAYESFDASKYPYLDILYLSTNKLTSLTFGGNNRLWGLMADNNELEEITFDGCPALSQINLSGNKFATLDVTPIKDILRALDISNNRFTFATLPLASDCPLMLVYGYLGQAKIETSCADGLVDLSSQASVNGTDTEYKWYLGDVTYDTETSEYTGEALYSDIDDPENPEFSVDGGVTSFHTTFDNYVTGLLTNAQFPGLTLMTVPVTVDRSGIEDILADSDKNENVDVFTLSGVQVLKAAAPASVGSLAPGMYIVKSKDSKARKVMVK